MNLKDRGNKKWNSLMLVEHQKRLKELKLKEKNLKKPELDQQQLEEIDSRIQKAQQNNLNLKISFYKNKRIKKINGIINKIDIYKKEIRIKQSNGQIKNILFNNIIEVHYK